MSGRADRQIDGSRLTGAEKGRKGRERMLGTHGYSERAGGGCCSVSGDDVSHC